MASSANPRRSTRSTVTRSGKHVDNGLNLNTNMTLRKSPTFHSPTSPSSSNSDDDFVPPSIRRSQTNLEDVIDSHRRRVALIVDDISKSLNISETTLSPTKSRFRDESLPVPRSFLDLPPIVDPAMAKEAEPERRQLRPRNRRPSRNQASDSGLGTSIGSTKEKRAAPNANKKASAITRSAAASYSTMEKVPGLSQRAINRISEHTIRPLLAKPSLKDFQPIVLDVPRRIRDKEIICLRDLEKTLIFMAPERTKTAALYLDFCLTSIRCIQSTVEYLSDREQTRPRDRPYTNLYFMDLEEQIRQYARQLATAKEKASHGEDDEMDVNPADEVRLYGGLSKNGRPAELVRVKKDGTAISMATGEPVDLDDEEDSKRRLKRSLSEQLEDEEEIMRSMARRKKNAVEEEPKKCREPGCNKEFKRPCDLTKHEKTHSRPWKCPVKSCKYHDYGWPTEKEMDRHHNDKHSSSPATYECYYKPCPYKSKRESNCKQHMEKAHGWHYVRTKTNGKKGGSSHTNTAEVTPQLTNAPTPGSGTNSIGAHTPPEESMAQFMPFAPGNSIDFPAYVSHDQFVDTIGQHPLHIPELDEMHIDMSPIADTPSTEPFETYSGFEDANASSAFTLDDDELYAVPAQLPTPDQSVFSKMLGQTSYQTYVGDDGCQDAMPAPHISPIGQGNAMLFTPKSLGEVDEGFDEFPSNGDFQLYPNTGKVGSYEPLFGEMPSAGMGFSQPSQEMFAGQMDWAHGSGYHNYHGHH